MLYEGYFRILDGKNGTVAQDIAGYPLSVDNNPSRPVMRTSNGSVVIAENDQTRARWIDPDAVVVWDDMGGADGALGLPITDANFADGVPRQEFERGYGTLTDGGVEATVLTPEQISADVSLLGRSASMILETFDRTSWWIDADGIRHWIDSVETWHCLGGESAKLGDFTSGWVVGAFPVGNAAHCG